MVHVYYSNASMLKFSNFQPSAVEVETMNPIRRYWRVLLLSSVLAAAAASAGEAICIQNATWISPDGAVQTCDWVCIINGGYIKSGCH